MRLWGKHLVLLLAFFSAILFADHEEVPISELISQISRGTHTNAFLAPEGVSEAEVHTQYLMELLKAKIQKENLNPKEIFLDFIQEGETIPKEVIWMITQLHHKGVNVRVLRHQPGSEKNIRKHEIMRAVMAAENPFYVLDKTNSADAQKLRPFYQKGLLKKIWNQAKARLKWFFSLPNGFTLRMHLSKENGFFKSWEKQKSSLKCATIYSAFTFGVTWLSVADIAAKHPEVNSQGTLIISTLLSFFWQYIQDASDRRHKQAQNYYHDRKNMDANTVFVNFSMFFDSLLTNAIVQTTLYNGDVNPEMVMHWATNSAVGLFAKGPKLVLMNFQDKMSEASYDRLNLVFNLFLSFLKLAHLYHWDNWATTLFYSSAAVGLFFLTARHFWGAKKPEDSYYKKFKKQLMKDVKYFASFVTGEPMNCGNTLIYIGKMPQDNPKELYIIPGKS
jgi:hypothetical protein